MKVLAGLITQGTGSLGGMTMSKNKSGYYLRSRVVPSNPRTALQSAIRAGLSAFATYWKALTSAQMAAWALYAKNTPIIGNNGQTHLISGFNWFLGVNQVRLVSGLDVVTDAPIVFGQASGPTVANVVFTASGVVTVSFTLIDPPLSADTGDVIQVYAGQPKTLGRAYFAGPWQYMISRDSFVSSITGIMLSTYTSYVASPGSQQWFKLVRSKPDGTYSQAYIVGPVAGM